MTATLMLTPTLSHTWLVVLLLCLLPASALFIKVSKEILTCEYVFIKAIVIEEIIPKCVADVRHSPLYECTTRSGQSSRLLTYGVMAINIIGFFESGSGSQVSALSGNR